MSHINLTKKTFQNGLIVIHHYDDSSPFVVVNTLYKVGSKHEQKDKTGFAHLFEHLMFEGTESAPNFDTPLQEAGGENNAFTNNDYTNYYDIVPALNAETALFLEADRMQNLKIESAKLKVQKRVVIEEFKETVTNTPYGDLQHFLRSMVYQNHPYQWSTIGKEISHIENARLKEVKEFYREYYQPDNAILVIAGNIDCKIAFESAEKWFSEIPSPLKKRGFFHNEASQTAPREFTHHAPVPYNMLVIGFQMPGRNEKGYFEGDLLTDILTSGKSSHWYEKLVKEKKIFSEIDTYITGSVDTGMFVIEGRIYEGVDILTAKNSIWEELDKIKNGEIIDKEIVKAKNQLLTYTKFSDASLLNKAIGLAYFEMLGDAEFINKEMDEYEKISKKSIEEFVNTYLNFHQSNTLYYLSNA